MYDKFYWLFSHLGLMTFTAAFITGFRHAPDAPVGNALFNIILYAIFIFVHILMTMPAFKKAAFGDPGGNPRERRIYIAVTVVTWVGLFIVHKPVGGLGFVPPAWIQFIGLCGVLLSVVAFFEFANLEGLGMMLGTTDTLSHTVGMETPLMTEGPYASVRHPMYRAAFFITFSSLVIHPNMSQLLFAIMVTASFFGFIPFEEHQLLKSRGEQYRDYMRKTPYRVFNGVW